MAVDIARRELIAGLGSAAAWSSVARAQQPAKLPTIGFLGTPSPSACAPDVILASASTSVAALQQTTRTVPIVFVNVIDPVGAGFVASLARPGGNSTGFTLFEYSLSGKWLELFKEIAPNLTRIAILRNSRRCMGRPSQHTLSKVLSVALCDRAAG